MSTTTPADLLFDQLRDLINVEAQLLESLPLLAARAEDAELKRLLLRHLSETDKHFTSLLRIFNRHEIEPGEDVSKAMAGLIEGGNKHLAEVKVPEIKDLMMNAHCLRIEHYEIAAYTITHRLAQRLKFSEEAMALSTILEEEESTAQHLLDIESRIFEHAARSNHCQ